VPAPEIPASGERPIVVASDRLPFAIERDAVRGLLGWLARRPEVPSG
jgi:hypothetical protein